MPKLRRVVISVTDKTGILDFARDLHDLGAEIVSTGGTARMIRESGVPVKDVSEVTGFPEMLDGRVKTLHPKISGGILAIREREEHMQALRDHDIQPVDMVVVNLYRFEEVAAKPGARLEELIENIDIGGPTMIRAAAKNYQDVAIVVSPSDYPAIVAELKQSGDLSLATKWKLAQESLPHHRRLRLRHQRPPRKSGPDGALPPRPRHPRSPPDGPPLRRESPPVRGAIRQARRRASPAPNSSTARNSPTTTWSISMPPGSWSASSPVPPPPSSSTPTPAAAPSRRRSPSPTARPSSAIPSRPTAASSASTAQVDEETAREVAKTFIEAIAAPGYTPEALAILTGKKNLRLMHVAPGLDPLVVKSISGGYLAQTADTAGFDRATAVVKSKRAPTDAEWTALEFGWKVAKHVKSNAIVYARPGQIAGVGAGQMSRVDSVKIGAMKAVLPLAGTVVASDAFFPFPDGVEEAVKNGATAFIQPGGSVRDQDVLDAADRLGVAMVFTGVRHFRH